MTETASNVLYHGTSKRNARKLLNQPFKDWCNPAQTPNLKHLAEEFPNRYFHQGAFGRGIYITENWRTAECFGPVVLEIKLSAGTKIVRLDFPPEAKILESLKREFGNEIFQKPFRKVLPKNKRLTLNETINLGRFFYSQRNKLSRFDLKYQTFEKLLDSIRSLLIRFGVGGWGDPSGEEGIVVFAADRIQVQRIALVISYRAKRTNNWDQPFGEHQDTDSFAFKTASNRTETSAMSVEWVKAANQSLALAN